MNIYKLTGNAFKVYHYLLKVAENKEIQISSRQISEDIYINNNTVNKALKELIEGGYIEKESNPRGNIYIIK